MKVVDGNLLDVESGVIVHQVNCQGAMGAGVAQALRSKWPAVYDTYMEAFDQGNRPTLGDINAVRVESDLVVVNLFSQEFYGPAGNRYTSYDAIATGFQTLAKDPWFSRQQIYIPYGMGSALGGGNWRIVATIIDATFPKEVTAVKLEDK